MQMLSSKDVNFVGYTYKNFEIVNDYQVPGMAELKKTSNKPKRPTIKSLFGMHPRLALMIYLIFHFYTSDSDINTNIVILSSCSSSPIFYVFFQQMARQKDQTLMLVIRIWHLLEMKFQKSRTMHNSAESRVRRSHMKCIIFF